MKWSTHRAICEIVCSKLGIHGLEREALLRGCIEPDLVPDKEVSWGRLLGGIALVLLGIFAGRRGGRAVAAGVAMAARSRRRARHHRPSRKLVMKYVKRAIKAYASGRIEEGAKALGRALHYLHDALLPAGPRHDALEKRIDSVARSSSTHLAEAPITEVHSLRELEELLRREIAPTEDPEKCVEKAIRLSLAVTTLVKKHLQRK